MNIPYGQGPGESPPYLTNVREIMPKMHNLPDFWAYWNLTPTQRGDVPTIQHALYKLTFCGYYVGMSDDEVKTMLYIWHQKRKILPFKDDEWAADEKPKALAKCEQVLLSKGKLNRNSANRTEEINNTKKMWCRNPNGEEEIVKYDRFQEFTDDPAKHEWIINDLGDCVSKADGRNFPALFRWSRTNDDVTRIVYKDGDPLNLRLDNLELE